MTCLQQVRQPGGLDPKIRLFARRDAIPYLIRRESPQNTSEVSGGGDVVA